MLLPVPHTIVHYVALKVARKVVKAVHDVAASLKDSRLFLLGGHFDVLRRASSVHGGRAELAIVALCVLVEHCKDTASFGAILKVYRAPRNANSMRAA